MRPHELVVQRLEPIGGATQDRGPLVRRNGGPAGRRARRCADRGVDLVGARVARMPDDVGMICGVPDRLALLVGRGQRGKGAAGRLGASLQSLGELSEALLVGKVEPARVETRAAVEMARQEDFFVRRAERLNFSRGRDRVGDEFVHVHAGVGDTVDEGSVGAVFQEAAHQIGKQRLVRADGRIDAARAVELVAADHFLVERLAHAVQALELVLAAIEVWACHGQHRGQRLGIVGGELRIDRVGRGQQFPRRGEISDVGVDLAGENGKALEPVDLGAFDLRIPVGALHETDHQPPLGAACEVDQPVDDEGAALAIGLDDEAEAVPAGKLGVEAERFEEIERQVDPVGLLGVDVEADVVGFRERRQMLDPRQEFAHDAGALDALEARMERRELDRNAGTLVDAALMRGLADGVHRALVFGKVARRVLGGRRRLAQHVVGKGESARLALSARVDRLLDRAAGDELLAHEPHGDVDAGADDRLAAASDRSRQRRSQALFAAGRHQTARQHQAPGRGVDEQRRAVADMGAPVAGRELVANERVAGGGVGNAQQGLGEAHQRHALLARERIFVDEALDAARPGLGPEPRGEGARERLDALGLIGGKGRKVDERRHALGFRATIRRRDRSAQRGLRQDLGAERGERVGHVGS